MRKASLQQYRRLYTARPVTFYAQCDAGLCCGAPRLCPAGTRVEVLDASEAQAVQLGDADTLCRWLDGAATWFAWLTADDVETRYASPLFD
jgi:hypothetical protein